VVAANVHHGVREAVAAATAPPAVRGSAVSPPG
jgi:hypothetical protein